VKKILLSAWLSLSLGGCLSQVPALPTAPAPSEGYAVLFSSSVIQISFRESGWIVLSAYDPEGTPVTASGLGIRQLHVQPRPGEQFIAQLAPGPSSNQLVARVDPERLRAAWRAPSLEFRLFP
jgi:hypothetical protein